MLLLVLQYKAPVDVGSKRKWFLVLYNFKVLIGSLI